jgi:transcriptional regulator with XRE-family HTH domain
MFGLKLKELREAKGWSQKKLADESGTSQKGISNWENGERVPAWDAVLKLAKALGVDCTAFGGLDEPTEEPPAKAKPGRPKKGK